MKNQFMRIALVLFLFCPFASAQWTQTNGPGGGYVQCFAVSGPNLFAGTGYGGVFLSTNRGETWNAANSGLTSFDVRCLAISGTNLFAGTKFGVYLSTDNGTSWTTVNSGMTGMLCLTVSGTNLWAGRGAGGPYLSTNNGVSWTAVSSGIPLKTYAVTAFAVSGTNLFAAIYDAGVPLAYVYRSTDNGTSWIAAESGLPSSDTYQITSLTFVGSELFASYQFDAGVYRSTDNGTSWTSANGQGISLKGEITSLAVSNTNLLAGASSGVYLSTNSGGVWTLLNTGFDERTSPGVRSLCVTGNYLFAGTSEMGVYLSTYMRNWRAVDSGFASSDVQCLLVGGANLFAGGIGASRSTDNGTSWTTVNSGLSNLAVHCFAVSGTNLFAGTNWGVNLSTDNGTSWTLVKGQYPNDFTESVYSLAANGTDLFAGTDYEGVYRSTDNGTSWTQTGLNVSNPVNALAVSGTNLFAGGPGVYLSTDNGTNWASMNGGLPDLPVLCLAVSGTNLFAGTMNGGVFLSTDTGWIAGNEGLTNLYVYSLAVVGTGLFASTRSGVFLSTNGGANWTAVSVGLQNSFVWSLAVKGTNLFAGTLGSGVWSRPLLDFGPLSVTMFVKSHGNDLLNGLSGPAAKRHVQSAIDVAPPGAVIRIAEGIYDENITLLSKSLTIEGGYDSLGWSKDVNLHPTILTGGGRGPVARISSGAVALEGLVMQNGKADVQGGGGLDISGGVTQLTRCVIAQNTATGASEWGGALTMLDGVLSMSGCRVTDNITSGGAGGLRLGSGTRFRISATVIAGNGGRPAVHINDASGTFINCTVADNPNGALLFNSLLQSDTLVNCILWNNGNYDVTGNTPIARYSDVQRTRDGTGNISSDPLFAHPQIRDYHLLPGSPCIDRGDPESPPDLDGSRADMGAFAFDHNAAGVDGPQDAGTAATYSLNQNYPNPFNPSTTIRYGLPHKSAVQLSVFNTLGQQVAVLQNGEQEAGYHEVKFDGSGLSSGVYFYKIQVRPLDSAIGRDSKSGAGSFVQTRKLLLLK